MTTVTVSDIIIATAKFHSVRLDALLGRQRYWDISHKRQAAQYLARTHTSASLPKIAGYFKQDHTTVLHSCRVVKKRMTPELEGDLDTIMFMARAESTMRSEWMRARAAELCRKETAPPATEALFQDATAV